MNVNTLSIGKVQLHMMRVRSKSIFICKNREFLVNLGFQAVPRMVSGHFEKMQSAEHGRTQQDLSSARKYLRGTRHAHLILSDALDIFSYDSSC